MNPNLEPLVKRAKEIINGIFGDTSVPVIDTKEALEELQSDIETYLEAVNSDLGRDVE